MLFTHKYAPALAEIPQPFGIKALVDFVNNYKKQKKKAVIVYGPVGCGKTAAVYALAKESKLEVVEVNSSDFRSADELKLKVGNAVSQGSLFGRGKLILIDEVDGISGSADRGGIAELARIIESSSFPVVLTCNDAYDKKLSSLRRKCLLVEFSSPNFMQVYRILKDICVKEKIVFDDSAVKTLARRTGGDIRAAINDLQSLSACGNIDASVLGELSERDKQDKMFNALFKVLKGNDIETARTAFDNVSENFDDVFLWLEENLTKDYRGNDIHNAYSCISRADVFRGRIDRQMYWRFIYNINVLLSAGVSLAKTEKSPGFTKYSAPQRLLKMWIAKNKFAARDAVVEVIADYCSCSLRKARAELPFAARALMKVEDWGEKEEKFLKSYY